MSYYSLSSFSGFTKGAGFQVYAYQNVYLLRKRNYLLGLGSMSFIMSSFFFKNLTVLWEGSFAASTSLVSQGYSSSGCLFFLPKKPPLPPLPPLKLSEAQKRFSVVILECLNNRPTMRSIMRIDQLKIIKQKINKIISVFPKLYPMPFCRHVAFY